MFMFKSKASRESARRAAEQRLAAQAFALWAAQSAVLGFVADDELSGEVLAAA